MEPIERILDKLDSIDERIARQGESLARLEERLSAHSASLAEHEAEDEKMRQSVKDLEKWSWKAVGVVSVVVIAANLFVKSLIK